MVHIQIYISLILQLHSQISIICGFYVVQFVQLLKLLKICGLLYELKQWHAVVKFLHVFLECDLEALILKLS
jgi:hypothetical protein